MQIINIIKSSGICLTKYFLRKAVFFKESQNNKKKCDTLFTVKTLVLLVLNKIKYVYTASLCLFIKKHII